MRMKKGISLIVLVITIIVMVILAGAVIITLENTNLIKHSKQATNKTNYSQEITRLEVLKNGILTDNLGKITLEEYVAELTAKGVIEGTPVNNADGSVTVTTTAGTEVKLTQDGPRNILIEIAGYEQSNNNSNNSDENTSEENLIVKYLYIDDMIRQLKENKDATWREIVSDGIMIATNVNPTELDYYEYNYEATIIDEYISITYTRPGPIGEGVSVKVNINDKFSDYSNYYIADALDGSGVFLFGDPVNN